MFVGRDGKARFRCHACDIDGDALDMADLCGVPVARWEGTGEIERADAPPKLDLSWERLVARRFLQVLPRIDCGKPAAREACEYLAGRGITLATCVDLDLRAPVRDLPYEAAEGLPAGLDLLRFFATAEELGLCRLGQRGYVSDIGRKVIVPVVDLDGDLHSLHLRTIRTGCADDRRYRMLTARDRRDTALRLWPLRGPGVAESIRSQTTALLVPGFVEAASLWQGGVRNVLALLGDRVPTDVEFEQLRRIGARSLVFAYHLDQEAQSSTKAQMAATIAEARWGFTVLVDALRDEAGRTRDADELPPERRIAEAGRLLREAGSAPPAAPAELALVAVVKQDSARLPRLRRSTLLDLQARYRRLASIRGQRRNRAIQAMLQALLLLPPGAALADTFPAPDLWASTCQRAVASRSTDGTSPRSELPALECLLLLHVWSAQSAAWAGGCKRGVAVRLKTFAHRLGVAVSAVERGLKRLLGWGMLQRFVPFTPARGARKPGTRGSVRRYRTRRYVALTALPLRAVPDSALQAADASVPITNARPGGT